MATTLTSAVPRVSAVVLSEADGFRSRENILVTLAGTALPSGSILTKSGAKYVPYVGGTTGADAVLYAGLPAGVTGDAKAVGIVRDAELNRFEMQGLDANAIAKLAATGLLVRGVVVPRISTPAI